MVFEEGPVAHVEQEAGDSVDHVQRVRKAHRRRLAGEAAFNCSRLYRRKESPSPISNRSPFDCRVLIFLRKSS